MTNRYLISFFSRSSVIPLLLLGIITLPIASVLSYPPLLAQEKTTVGSAEGETADAKEDEPEKFKDLEDLVEGEGMKPEPSKAATEGIKNVKKADASSSTGLGNWSQEKEAALNRLLYEDNLPLEEQLRLSNELMKKAGSDAAQTSTAMQELWQRFESGEKLSAEEMKSLNNAFFPTKIDSIGKPITRTGQNTGGGVSTGSGTSSRGSIGSGSSAGSGLVGSSSGTCSRGGSCGGGGSGGSSGGGGAAGLLGGLLGGGGGAGGTPGGIAGGGGGILGGVLGGMLNKNQNQNTQSGTQDDQEALTSTTTTMANPAAGLTVEERKTINELCQGQPAGCRIGLIQKLKTTGSLTDEDPDIDATDEQPEDNSSSNSF